MEVQLPTTGDSVAQTTATGDPRALLGKIQQAWVECVGAFGETLRAGSFVATFNPINDLVWMNYALVAAEPGTSLGAELEPAIDQLRAPFTARRRFLRFEFIETLWPELAPVLERVGLVRQARLPILVCTPRDLRTGDASPAVRVERLSADESDVALGEFLRLRDRGFGMPEPAGAESMAAQVRELREQLVDGRVRSARAWVEDALAGAGSLMRGDDVTEIVGVVTDVPYRRRGVARAISRFLAADHFARGGSLVWLSAGDDTARRVYEQIGFRFAGWQLNYIDPAWKG